MTERLAALRRPRVLAALVAVALVLAGVVLARDALAARSALQAAQSQVVEVRAALGEGDVRRAVTVMEDARSNVAGAQRRVDGPLWWVAARVPLVGRSPRVLVRVVDVADVALDVAGDAVAQGARFLGDDGSVEVTIADGRIDLTPMRLAGSMLASLPLDRLEAARQRLTATPDTWTPELVRSGRREAIDLADLALDTLTDARDLTAALPRVLGGERPRSWAVAVQTSGELRATGGLIGYLTVLQVDDGAFRLEPPVVYDAVDQTDGKVAPAEDPLAQTLSGGWQDPVETSDEFTARYGLRGGGGLMSNVNLDPHLPMTGDVLHRLYEKRTGQDVDGVILLDPVGLELLIEATGQPVAVPQQGRVDDRIPDQIAPDEIAEWATFHVYEVLGIGRSAERDRFLKAFGTAMFSQVFGGSWDGVAMSRAVGQATAGRHLQIYSADPDEQAELEALGVAGVFGARTGSGDLLSLVANNAVGGKQDVHVAHHLTARIGLGELRDAGDGQVTARREIGAEVALENPLPATGMDTYIIGNCLVDQFGNQCFDGPQGVNRTWFTIWTPATTGFVAARDAEGQALDLGAGIVHGHHATDHFLETGPESTGSYQVDLAGPATLRRDGPDLVYALTVWHQAKAIPDHLDLAITGPEGWAVAEVALEGGGDGSGMGAGGDGRPVQVTGTDDGTVRVEGAATQDVHIEIRYRRSLLGRLWTWIDAPL